MFFSLFKALNANKTQNANFFLLSVSDTGTAKIMFIQINIGKKGSFQDFWLFKLIKSLTMQCIKKIVVPFRTLYLYFMVATDNFYLAEFFEAEKGKPVRCLNSRIIKYSNFCPLS